MQNFESIYKNRKKKSLLILKSKTKISPQQHKRPISKKYIDINKIVVSNKVSFDKKNV